MSGESHAGGRAPRARRVLVTASTLPPMAGGSAKMLRNLLAPFPSGSLVYVRGNNDMFPEAQDAPLGPAVAVDMPNVFRRRGSRISLSRYLEYLWVPWSAWRMARVARREKVSAVFANYPFGFFLVAAWLAAKSLRLPLFVYMHSLWEETTDASVDGWMAHRLEPRIFRDAAAVYAPTRFAIEHYRRKHGLEVRLLPHTVNLDDAGPEGGAGRKNEEGPHRILFTGGVYNMNRDALLQMVEAVEKLGPSPDGRDVRLVVCAPNDPAVLAGIGVRGDRVETRFVDSRTAMRLQKEADILYLPLAFDTPWKDEVRTVYPTKAVEYLVSGTPILLHAPGDSYTVHEAREMGWALVVDRQDGAALQGAIARLLTDRPLREELAAGARSAAEGRDANRIAAGLARDLGLL